MGALGRLVAYEMVLRKFHDKVFNTHLSEQHVRNEAQQGDIWLCFPMWRIAKLDPEDPGYVERCDLVWCMEGFFNDYNQTLG